MKPTTAPLFDPIAESVAPLWRVADIDPNWPEHGGGKVKRGADRHYQLANVRRIREAILGSGFWRPYPDAHLFMWVTDNYLPDGLWLMTELGFRYVRTFAWFKVIGDERPLDFDTGLAVDVAPDDLDLRMGIGQYARGAHELMLFGVRGDGFAPEVFTGDRSIPSAIIAPHPKDERGQRIHSRKPTAHYELIEARSHGPRMEFFARIARPGWLPPWGDQAPEAS